MHQFISIVELTEVNINDSIKPYKSHQNINLKIKLLYLFKESINNLKLNNQLNNLQARLK
jgi:hypothetical protein